MAGTVIVAIIGAVATLLAAALPPYIQRRNEARTGSEWLPPPALLVYVAFVQAVGCVLALSVGIVAANNRGGTPLAFVEFLTVAAIASTLFAFFAVKINGAVIGVAANYTAAVLLPMFSLHALLDGWEDYTKEFTFRPGLGYLFLLFLFMALLAVADITTLSALRTGHAAATTGEKSDRPPANGPRNDQNN